MSEGIRFYFDEHIGHAIARGLRRRGVDVLTLVEADMLGAKDEEHMALARSQRRVIVTHDEDFLRLAAEGLDHAGIVYAPQGRTVGAMVQGLMLIAQVMTPKRCEGALNISEGNTGVIDQRQPCERSPNVFTTASTSRPRPAQRRYPRRG